MDKLVDKFYNGNLHKFGFGTVGSIKQNIMNHKVMTPRPIQIKYNNNQTLLNQNRSQNNINNINKRYTGNQTLFNNPVPKTQYSMGLQVPTTSEPFTTKALTLPFKQTEYNGMETVPNGQTKRYFKPEILKVQMLEQKIKEIEEKSKADKRRMREIIEGNVLNVNPPPNNQSIASTEPSELNSNKINNPANLEQAMNNLRSQQNGMLDFNQKQALRREQIQKELLQAREKLKIDRYDFPSKEYSEEGGEEFEEEEEDEEEDDKLTKKDENSQYLLNVGMRPGQRNSLKTRISKPGKTTKNENISPAQEEANEFIHNIPDHVALKLQNDNFKVRANLAQVKDGFRNIRNVLEDKLDALQMAQKINFEKIRFIIEQGGNKKMIAGLRKLIDGEDIDINNVEEDVPEYVKNLPDMIEEKLKKNEELRRNELNREKLEEQQMMDDEIGERFNVTNASALREFDPENIKKDIDTEANPWEKIDKQTDYQYIPGRGTRMRTDHLSTNKFNYLTDSKKGGILDKNFNPYNKRMITEEHENIIVNKIAEKIFKTMKDNNFLGQGMILGNQNQPPVEEPKEPTKPPSKTKSQSISNRDGLSERLSNLAENKKESIKSKSKTSKTKSTSKKSKKKKKKRKSQTTEEEEEEEEEDEYEEEEDDEEGEEEEDDEEGEEEEDDEEGGEEDDEEEGEDEEGDDEEEDDDEEGEEEEEEESSKKKKKKKKKGKSSSVTESTNNKKKNKNKKGSSDVTESTHKKKNKNKKESSDVTESTHKKKRKNKDESVSGTKKKKKNKHSSVTETEENTSTQTVKKKKKH